MAAAESQMEMMAIATTVRKTKKVIISHTIPHRKITASPKAMGKLMQMVGMRR